MAKMCGYITLIGDDFDTSLVTKRLGQVPSEVREKTEVLRNGSLFGHCEWGMSTEMLDSDRLLPVCRQLCNLLPMQTELLKQVAEDCRAQWHILFLIKVGDDFPALYLDAEFIRFAAEINGQIGFDVYMLNDLGQMRPFAAALRELSPTAAETSRLHECIAGRNADSADICAALFSMFTGRGELNESCQDE